MCVCVWAVGAADCREREVEGVCGSADGPEEHAIAGMHSDVNNESELWFAGEIARTVRLHGLGYALVEIPAI